MHRLDEKSKTVKNRIQPYRREDTKNNRDMRERDPHTFGEFDRECLKCGKKFVSTNRYVRTCYQCKVKAEGHVDWNN